MPEFFLEPKKAILILGEKGRGKTTHLLALHQKNPDAPYVHLPEFGKHPSIPRSTIVFLDEAQRVPRPTRRFIWQRAKTWVIASHENHASELEQAGFKVEILHLTGLTLEKLEAVIEKRLEWAKRSDLEPPHIPQQRLEQLLKQFGDDLRGIEGALYDEYQKLSKEFL